MKKYKNGYIGEKGRNIKDLTESVGLDTDIEMELKMILVKKEEILNI